MKVFVKWLLPVVALLMLAFGGFHVVRSQPSDQRLPPPATPARSPYPDAIAAAGIVESRGENVAVGAAVPGIVLQTWVTPDDVGKYVSQGAPLFRVDDRHLRAQLAMQKANVASARAQYARLEAMPRPEEVPSAEAKLKSAEASLVQAQDEAKRARVLRSQRVVSEEDFVQRQVALQVARQQRAQAKADLDLLEAGAWKADKDVSRAAIALAEAQAEQTQTEIDRATVRAPISGHVLQVSVHQGEYVGAQPGQALVMMGDLSAYHVRADVDEHDVPRFAPTAPARAFVRGHAGREIRLSFVRLEQYVTPKKSLTGDNTERVDTRVLQAIYRIESGEQTVFVGQQLDVFIEAGTSARTKP
jgi:multidrug resistance efflux pump